MSKRRLLELVDPLGEHTFRGRRVQSELLELYREKRQALIDVVMELSREPASLLFLRLDKASADGRHRLLGDLPLGDVDAGSDIAGKRSRFVVHRAADIEQPSVSAVA